MVEDLANVGNVVSFRPAWQLFAWPKGEIRTPKLILKQYLLSEKGNQKPSYPKLIQDTERFIKRELVKGELAHKCGLGFSMLSQGALNICRWGQEDPKILFQDLYEFDGPFVSGARKAGVKETGSFCIYELGIVAHERKAWDKFLKSQRTEQDKQNYLNDWVLGGTQL